MAVLHRFYCILTQGINHCCKSQWTHKENKGTGVGAIRLFVKYCLKAGFLDEDGWARELIALLLLSFGCLVIVNVMLLFITVPCLGL